VFQRIRLPLLFLFIALVLALLISFIKPIPSTTNTTTPTAVNIPVQMGNSCTPTVLILGSGVDKFSVEFPCTPTHVVRKANAVPFGEIEIVSEEVNLDGAEFAAAYVNYADKLPAAAFDVVQGIILDGAKRAVTRGQPVQNPAYKDFKLGNIPGVEVTAEGSEKRLRGKIWLVRQTSYQLVILYPKTLTDETAIDRFLDSFTPISDK